MRVLIALKEALLSGQQRMSITHRSLKNNNTIKILTLTTQAGGITQVSNRETIRELRLCHSRLHRQVFNKLKISLR